MAILKHSTSKNHSYIGALNYLMYKHKEDSNTGFYTPILDEFGLYQQRDNYALCYLDGHGFEGKPEDWPLACMNTNLTYRKNSGKKDRKQHIYVISHPASDTPLLTKEMLLEEGKAFVRDNLKGYDALIAVHMDTDHYHIHISINSVRSVGRQEEPWMMKDKYGNVLQCELKAGCKHQNSPQFRRHCQQWLMDYTRSHGLTVEDNLQIEDQRKEERYSNTNESLRNLILETAGKSKSLEDLQRLLLSEYSIQLVRRGTTYSIHLPGSKKAKRLKMIGLNEMDLYHAMGIEPDLSEDKGSQSAVQIEKKQYVQWLYQRRARNSAKAEDIIANSANLIAGRIRQTGQRYNPWEFRELNELLQQTVYLQRDLETERDKQFRLQARWQLYLDSEGSDKKAHGDYLIWCGCHPDEPEEFEALAQTIAATELQIQEASSLREALVETCEDWRDQNDNIHFYFKQAWTISREAQLKQELRAIKANRKKLEQIAFRCEEAAYRRIYKREYLEKAAYFREQWHKKLQQEDALKARIKEIKEERKALKYNDRNKNGAQ